MHVGPADKGGVRGALIDLAGVIGAMFTEMGCCSTIEVVDARLALATPDEKAMLASPNTLEEAR